MQCGLCSGQGHHWTKCPLFGKPEEFTKAFAPQFLAAPEPEVTAKRRSLAPSFTELFGRDKDRALQEVLDHPDTPQEEKLLALELLIGTKKMDGLGAEEQEMLTSMNHRLVFGSPRTPGTEQAHPKPKPRTPDTSSDPYSSVNYDFDRDSQNSPA